MVRFGSAVDPGGQPRPHPGVQLSHRPRRVKALLLEEGLLQAPKRSFHLPFPLGVAGLAGPDLGAVEPGELLQQAGAA